MKPYPTHYQRVMPYLAIPGGQAFLAFTQELLGATVHHAEHREDGSISHAELSFGDATIMFSEATEGWPAQAAMLFIWVDDADAVYARALAMGCTSAMEPSDQDYGRAAGVTDAHGITWWLTSPLP